MSIPVMHPRDNIFFFKLAFNPCKNIHYRPDSTRLNATRFVLFTFKQKENFCTCPGLMECLFIDHAPVNKTKTNKMDHDLHVFEWKFEANFCAGQLVD